MNDPFAPNTNGVPADPWSTPASSETPARQEAPVSVESVNEVSVTFKQHSGFDSPWIVVRGATPTQVKDQLRELYAEELIEAVAQTAQKFAATKPGTSAGVAPRQGASSPPRQNNSTGNGGGGSLPPG
ncbi:hypothetical protein, partial [Actinomadura oligospora]|uniref:hypothetical protein n=1 Tax=Actinomadura oligospora TaxID=111804 RepID=UPI0012F92825